MSEVFISYARSTADEVEQVAGALQALGYSVWRDEDLPAHRPYAEVIEERLEQAKAVLVFWSKDALVSQWVRAEANRAREAGKLVQVTLDRSVPPIPFDQIQCADLGEWAGDPAAPGWRKALASVAELVGRSPATAGGDPHPAAAPGLPSIALLPFADISGGGSHDYFCDGMVMEIVTALSRFGSLLVIASDSSLTYRNDVSRSRREIAGELGVRYLLEGSVARAGQKVRIFVQLIDVDRGGQIWADRFEDTAEDLFALQDRVANAVAARIVPALARDEMQRARQKPTTDLRAYDLYLQALAVNFTKPGRGGMEECVALLDEALRRDSDYALALAYSAFLRGQAVGYGWTDEPERLQREARNLAQRSLQLGGDDSDVLAWAGLTLRNTALVERALELNPGAVSAWAWSAWAKVCSPWATDFDPRESLERFETALRLDPRSERRWNILAGMGWALLFLGRYDEAIRTIHDVEVLAPEFEGPAVALTAAYAHAGRLKEAKAVLARVRRETIEAMFGFFPHEAGQDIIRRGLALAGADV